MNKELFFKVEQEQSHTSAVHRVAGHQLRVRKAFVNVLIDDVGLIQNQVTLHQNRHLAVGVHDIDVFGFVVQVNIANFKVHAFFKKHKTAAVRKRAGCT